MKLLTAFAVSAILAGFPVMSAEPKVSSVVVSVDADAMKNAEAAKYWSHLDKDIEGAIMQMMVGNIEDGAPTLTVNIDGLSLANAFLAPDGIANATLTGHVFENTDSGTSKVTSYDLSVQVKSAMTLLPIGTDMALVTWTTPELYPAIVHSFAEGVVSRLK